MLFRSVGLTTAEHHLLVLTTVVPLLKDPLVNDPPAFLVYYYEAWSLSACINLIPPPGHRPPLLKDHVGSKPQGGHSRGGLLYLHKGLLMHMELIWLLHILYFSTEVRQSP